ILGQESPFDAARETGSAAAAEAGRLDGVDDLGGRHLAERLGKRAIAAVSAITVERGAIGLVDAAQQYWFVIGPPKCAPSARGCHTPTLPWRLRRIRSHRSASR